MDHPATTETHRRIAYFPALDGIRAATMFAIFAFHAEGARYLQGGYLAVSTFFTLSGFLITSLLTAEFESRGSIGLRAFWRRRFRRLLPASWLTLAFVAGPFAWWFATGAQMSKLRGDLVASLFQVLNWHDILQGSRYFELSGRPSPVFHFWSLAIEEQFYLVFPLLVVALYRGRHRHRRLLVGIATLATISAILGTLVLHGDRAYFGTDTRAFDILIGAALALALGRPRMFQALWAQRSASASGIVASFAIVWTWFTWTSGTEAQASGRFLLYCLMGVFVILGAINPGPLQWVLSRRPLVWLGTISYGMYLFHVPMIQMLNQDVLHLASGPRLAIQMAATIAAAALSSRYLEMPIRQHRMLQSVWSRRITPAVSATIIIVFAATAPSVNPARAQSFEKGATTLRAALTTKRIPVVATGDASAIPSLRPTSEFRVKIAAPDSCGYGRSGGLVGEAMDPFALRNRGMTCNQEWQRVAGIIDSFLPSVVVAAPFARDRSPRALTGEGAVQTLESSEMRQWLRAELEVARARFTARGARVIWVRAVGADDPSVTQYNAALSAVAGELDTVADTEDVARLAQSLARSPAPRTTVDDGVPVDPATIPGAPHVPPVATTGKVRIAVFGDSVAYGMAYGLQLWANRATGADVVNWGRFHCPIARGGRIRFQEAEEAFQDSCDWGPILPSNIETTNPNVVAIVSGAWDFTDRLLPGDTKWRAPGDPVFDNYFLREFAALVDMLGARGARVVVLTHHHVEVGKNFGFRGLPESQPARVDRLNEMFRSVAASRSDFVSILEFGAWMGGLPKGETSSAYLADGLHLRDEMSYAVAQWLGPDLLAIARGEAPVVPDPALQADPGPLPGK